MEQILEKKSFNDQLIIPKPKGYDILKWNEIIYMHAEGNYTNIFCIQDRKYCFSRVLKYVASKIESDNFLRCHRSYIINTKYLKEINTTNFGSQCLMIGDLIIPISKRNKSVVKEWINARV